MHCTPRISELIARCSFTICSALYRTLFYIILLAGFATQTIDAQPVNAQAVSIQVVGTQATDARPALTGQELLITYQKSHKFSQKLLENLQQSISNAGFRVHFEVLNQQTLNSFKSKKYSLIIALGSKTTQSLLHETIETPIFSVLMPRHLAIKLRRLYPNKNNWSSLLLDQPIQRQLELITSISGKHRKTGVLLGPYTVELKKTLEKSARASEHALFTETVTGTDQLTSALKVLSSKSDILLTLPDPVIYNRKTIRGILLLSYRKKLPIIGFSQAYVKAGAIAAIYSEPAQISQQVTAIILDYFRHHKFHQKEYLPDDFSVALNKKVARSLGINLPEKEVIISRIKNIKKRRKDAKIK